LGFFFLYGLTPVVSKRNVYDNKREFPRCPAIRIENHNITFLEFSLSSDKVIKRKI
jgi:hypothetical protein